MNKNRNIIPGKPGAKITLLFALVALAVSALPELGFVGAAVLSATVVYMASARANFLIMLIPFGGAALSYLRGGVIFAAVTAVVVATSIVSGLMLNRGGFHRALMAFVFTATGLTVGAVALYTKYLNISASELREAYELFIGDMLAGVLDSAAAAGGRLSLEEAQLMINSYEELLSSMFVYAPAILAAGVGVVGVIALRVNGFLHDITGSIMYPRVRRPAFVSRPFAVVYLAAMFLGALDGGIVGLSAANVMTALLVPGAAAGFTSMKIAIKERRKSGRRGFPVTLLIVILATLGLSVGVGLTVLAVIACMDAFKNGKKNKAGKTAK